MFFLLQGNQDANCIGPLLHPRLIDVRVLFYFTCLNVSISIYNYRRCLARVAVCT